MDKLAIEAPEKAKKKNRDKKEIEKERVKIFVIQINLFIPSQCLAKQGTNKGKQGDCCLEE
jgi:hypothetical protein